MDYYLPLDNCEATYLHHYTKLQIPKFVQNSKEPSYQFYFVFLEKTSPFYLNNHNLTKFQFVTFTVMLFFLLLPRGLYAAKLCRGRRWMLKPAESGTLGEIRRKKIKKRTAWGPPLVLAEFLGKNSRCVTAQLGRSRVYSIFYMDSFLYFTGLLL